MSVRDTGSVVPVTSITSVSGKELFTRNKSKWHGDEFFINWSLKYKAHASPKTIQKLAADFT